MRLVFFDCESYYDRKTGYSLSAMTQEAYIRDPRFALHGAAIKWDFKTLAQWYDERELRYILKNEDWSDTFLVSHHAQWDHGVLSMHYDVHPKMSGCTLAMSRLLFGNHLSVSLDSVRKYFNMPPKTTPYGQFEGLHWREMSSQVQQALADGCKDEVESKAVIFQGLLRDYKFPIPELEVIDTIVKMFSEPVLDLDPAMLAKVWEDEAKRKADGNEALGVEGSELRSAERFCQLLERMDRLPPSPRTTPSCGISCVSTTTRAFVRWRKHASQKNPRFSKAAPRRWAGWRHGDLHLFIYFTLELERFDRAAAGETTGSTSNAVPLFVARSARRLDTI
jgi:hypothetical protein